jgi:hypothetical protein
MQTTEQAGPAAGNARGVETLNARELTAIGNLFALAAIEQDTSQETIRSITAARFGAADIAAVPRRDYDDVIRFLVELIDDLSGGRGQP